MSLRVVVVGRPGRVLAAAIAEYERRAARYWPVEVVEVRQERAGKRGGDVDRVKRAEAGRLRERIPAGAKVVVLTREGVRWSSLELANQLEESVTLQRRDTAFLIGGAAGLDDELLRAADVRLSLSPFTLPHEMARLLLAEQLYRAGTIVRGEPYHKGADC